MEVDLAVADAQIAIANRLSQTHDNSVRLPDILLDRVPVVQALWLTDLFVNSSVAAMIAHAFAASPAPGAIIPQVSLTISASHVLRMYDSTTGRVRLYV